MRRCRAAAVSRLQRGLASAIAAAGALPRLGREHASAGGRFRARRGRRSRAALDLSVHAVEIGGEIARRLIAQAPILLDRAQDQPLEFVRADGCT
jgi:hypothetical protein